MRLAPLLRYVRPARALPQGEACEVCSAPAPPPHPHVLDLRRQAVCCACRACGLLFDRPGAGARFRTIPARVLEVAGYAIADADWAALQIPVRLAFLVRRSADGPWLAVYPSPAGPTESTLPPEAWRRVAAGCPLAALVEPGVEALLVRGEPQAGPGRAGGGAGPLRCFLVPIDRCYELVGRIRSTWRGFDGGDEVRRDIDAFFAGIAARARPPGEASCSSVHDA